MSKESAIANGRRRPNRFDDFTPTRTDLTSVQICTEVPATINQPEHFETICRLRAHYLTQRFNVAAAVADTLASAAFGEARG